MARHLTRHAVSSISRPWPCVAKDGTRAQGAAGASADQNPVRGHDPRSAGSRPGKGTPEVGGPLRGGTWPMSVPGVILGRVEASNPAWVPGTHRTAPGVTDEHGDLLDAMRAFGEAFNARQAGQVARGQDLMTEARNVLGSAGVQLVLALLKAGRIPYPDAPWWPVFLSELVRHEPDEPLYVALPQSPPRPQPRQDPPPRPEAVSLADEFRKMGLT